MKNLILAILLVSSVQAFAFKKNTRGNDGGGGGGFCFEGQRCVTLAEAGFRFQDENDYAKKPELDLAVLNEAIKIIDLLPVYVGIKEQLKMWVLSKPGVYKKVVSYNEKALKKIKNEYIALLKSQNVPTDNLVIYAVSTIRQNTYLLPEFENLGLRSKALILIHEALVREEGSVLDAVKVDGLIIDALNGKIDRMGFVDVLVFSGEEGFKENPRTLTYLLNAYVSDLNTIKESYMPLKDLLPSTFASSNSNGGDFYCMNAIDEAKFYEKHNRLWQVMSKYKLKCITKIDHRFGISKNEKIIEEGKKICSEVKDGSYVASIEYITPDMVSMYETYPIVRVPRNPIIVTCENGALSQTGELSMGIDSYLY